MPPPANLGSLASHVRSLAERRFSADDAFEIAFLIHEGIVHWSAHAATRPHEPHSALTDLIQALFQLRHDQAFFILRERIYTTARASAFDRAMVKVAAKRFTDGVKPSIAASETFQNFKFCYQKPAAPEPACTDISALWPGTRPHSDADWLKLCSRLADSVERGQVLHRYHRPLAALIVTDDGTLLSASTHAGALDKTQHAELRAAQSYFASNNAPLPPGCRVYVSLKPCRMCASALAHLTAEPSKLKIIYLNDDPGPHARNTVLNAQVEQKAASASTVLAGEIEAFSKRFQCRHRD